MSAPLSARTVAARYQDSHHAYRAEARRVFIRALITGWVFVTAGTVAIIVTAIVRHGGA